MLQFLSSIPSIFVNNQVKGGCHSLLGHYLLRYYTRNLSICGESLDKRDVEELLNEKDKLFT